jgi:hypothetical protein
METADKSRLLCDDVAAMIRETERRWPSDSGTIYGLAQDVIVVVRERVLQEIESYARENVR